MKRMLNFQMSQKLVFGNGAIKELPEIIKRLNCTRPLLVTDPGIVKAGLKDLVIGVLNEKQIRCTAFEDVESDPSIEVLIKCYEYAKNVNCDMILGLGGGSSLDIAKVAGVMLGNNVALNVFYGINNIPKPGVPTIMIPTTSGTGSEVTPIAVLSDETEQIKKGIVSDYLYPSVALVDPKLTMGLPPSVTAYTGIDALTHAIEAYTNKYSQPFVDTFALEAIRLIGKNISTAVKEGSNAEARYNMSLASLYGGMCLGSVNTAAVHALAYPLGGMFNVPHGIANSLLLPYVMEFNLDSNLRKFANIANALGENISNLNDEEAAKISVKAVTKLCSDIGIISRIRELNIPEKMIGMMADAAMKVTRLLGNNPKKLHLEDVRRIYEKAY